MKQTNSKPLQRHPALVPLSKDHHFGLLLCWKIRTGIGKGISEDRIVDYVNYFFDVHLKTHFHEEEQYIFILLNENDMKRKEAEDQHQRIYKLMELLNNKPDDTTDILTTIEKTLNDHIRFEERDLFPYIQQQLNEQELENLRVTIEAIHHSEKDEWPDPFWLG